MIRVQSLSKTYRTHKKDPGLVGSLKSLFHRRWLDRHALLIKGVLQSFVPFSVFASIPAQALFDDVGWTSVLPMLAVVVGFFLLNRWLWERGLRRYASAQG